MKKQYYDHRCKQCPGCAHYRPAGTRDVCGRKEFFREGCAAYGYTFHDYEEDADDCPGFHTPEEYARIQEMKSKHKKK